MPPLPEGTANTDFEQPGLTASAQHLNTTEAKVVPKQLHSNPWRPRSRAQTAPDAMQDPEDPLDDQYESDLVNVLDTIDPEVATLNTLVNVQNSLFVPDLGRLLKKAYIYLDSLCNTSHSRYGTTPSH